MNKIEIEKIIVNDNTVKCQYQISGEWKKYFNLNVIPEISYSIDISGVPESVLVIPFMCNFLPIAWLCDATFTVKSLDVDFYENILNIRKGYQTMYPMLNFAGNIEVKEKQMNTNAGKKSACFFSGGVDAYTTLFRHIEEKPILMTIWGADVKTSDISSWRIVDEHIKSVAEEFKLQYVSIKSNFRETINEGILGLLVEISGEGWWHGFQHGIGIISHAAPLAFVLGVQNVYIASSFPESMKGMYTCASDPMIDEKMFYCGCRTIHDGYEMDRQAKIRYLVTESKKTGKRVNLRVCWEATGGKNCCHCEKCYRTILEIVSEGGNPNDYGFLWNVKSIRRCQRDMQMKITSPQFFVDQFYPIIQKKLKEHRNEIVGFDNYRWLIDMDFSKFNDMPVKKIRNSLIGRNIIKIIKRVSVRIKGK